MEEVEEAVENLMHNEIEFLDLSFEFAQQAPFTTLLYHRRLPDFSDEEFATLLDVLMEALSENTSVRQVHIDWSFLRILRSTEQQMLFRSLSGAGRSRTGGGLRDVSISGDTANTSHQHLSVFSVVRLLEARGGHPNVSIQKLTMDAMGALKLQVFTHLEHFSTVLQSASYLSILRLENLVLPQHPNFCALDSFVQALTTCPALHELHVSVSLPRQYRRITQPLVEVLTLARLENPSIVRLHNWGLQAAHGLALLHLPHIVTLDVWNNPLGSDDTVAGKFRKVMESRQQMRLQELRGIHHDDSDDENDDNIVTERYLMLNRCGRAAASASWHDTLDYWAAINVAGAQAERRHTRNHPRNEKKSNTILDALYTAIREQPLV